MAPAELLLSAAITLGVVVPVTAMVDKSRPAVDMSRYEVQEHCHVGNRTVDRCIVDVETGRHMGIEPHHLLDN